MLASLAWAARTWDFLDRQCAWRHYPDRRLVRPAMRAVIDILKTGAL